MDGDKADVGSMITVDKVGKLANHVTYERAWRRAQRYLFPLPLRPIVAGLDQSRVREIQARYREVPRGFAKYTDVDRYATELHNPELSATPMVVRFDTTRDDFPPNLDGGSLKVQNLLLYFVRADGATFEMPVTYLHFNGQGSSVPAGQPEAISDQGAISTRRTSGINWRWIKSAPAGAWELSLKSSDPTTDSDIRNHFANDDIEDILFVITYSGRTPEWPT